MTDTDSTRPVAEITEGLVRAEARYREHSEALALMEVEVREQRGLVSRLRAQLVELQDELTAALPARPEPRSVEAG